MILEHKYWVFKNGVSPYICDEILSYVEEKKTLKRGQVGGEEKDIKTDDPTYKKQLSEVRNSNIIWMHEQWVHNEVFPFVETANKNAGWNFNISGFETVQFSKYNVGQFYDWHPDQYNKPYDGEKNWKKGLIRKISITVSLSDPRDYEGGFLEFAYPQHEPDKCDYVKAREAMPRGSIIVFPSYTWHRVTPVTKGTRLSLVQWNLGPGYI